MNKKKLTVMAISFCVLFNIGAMRVSSQDELIFEKNIPKMSKDKNIKYKICKVNKSISDIGDPWVYYILIINNAHEQLWYFDNIPEGYLGAEKKGASWNIMGGMWTQRVMRSQIDYLGGLKENQMIGWDFEEVKLNALKNECPADKELR